MVIDHAHEPIKGELMQYVLQGVADGGYWCEAVDLVENTVLSPNRSSRKRTSQVIRLAL